jgi:mono/diheme cytochrome c family protein
VALVGASLACGPERSGASADDLWRRECVNCHGEDGRGHPARRRLEPQLDLTASPMVRNRSRGLIFQRIAYGYSTMPGFVHRMPQGDIEALVDFVERLAER